MRVVVLTTSMRPPAVGELIRALVEVGHPPRAVLVARPRSVTLASFVLFEVMLGRLRPGERLRRWRQHRPALESSWQACRREGIPVVESGWPVNHPRLSPAIRALEADVLLHVGGPLFRAETIRTPNTGLLNCHMGKLPAMRGVNVAEWSVLRGLPVGNTVHFIDEGIDTGDVLYFREEKADGLESIAELRRRLSSANATDLAHGVRLLADPEFTPTPQAQGDGRQHFRMHPALRRVVEARLRRGYDPAVAGPFPVDLGPSQGRPAQCEG